MPYEPSMNDYPKSIKRALHQLCERAYEAELGRALTALREEFDRWERGEINAFDLGDAIHEFYRGPSRELYNRYLRPDLGSTVASAISNGLLDRNEINPDVLTHIAPDLSYFDATK